MNLTNVKKSLEIMLKVGITPLLVGDAGIGKTETVQQFCDENNYKMISIRLGQLSDASDLLGLCDFKTDSKGKKVATQFLAPNYLHEALEAAENGQKFIIFLDELNRSHKDLLQSIFELVYDKKISCNGFHIPEGSGIIAAQNPSTDDYDVLDFSDAAFNDRFCHIKVEATVNEWVKYAKKIKVDSSIVDFISEQNSMLEIKRNEFSLGVQPSRRSWIIADKLKTICEKNNTSDEIFSELLMGLVGVESGTSYLSFLENYDRLVTAKDILNNYSKVQSKIKEYSTTEENRNDLLGVVTDSIEDFFVEESKKKKFITKKQADNFIQFLMDIPIGNSYGLMLHASLKLNPDFLLRKKNGEPSYFAESKLLGDYFKEKLKDNQELLKKQK